MPGMLHGSRSLRAVLPAKTYHTGGLLEKTSKSDFVVYLMETLFDQAKLNLSVKKDDVSRLGRQSRAIYEQLRRGPMNVQGLKTIAAQYNARINELRKWLRNFGWTIDLSERRSDGNNLYKLVPWDGSKEQARQLQRAIRG